MAFWCTLDCLEVFHFPSVVSYSIPLLSRLIVFFPHSSAFILIWHPPHPILALRSKCLKIHSMFLKHSVLARIMRHFGERLSFPQFVIPMTTNIFTIPTNLPFRFRYHLPLPSPWSSRSTNLFWILISIRPIISPFSVLTCCRWDSQVDNLPSKTRQQTLAGGPFQMNWPDVSYESVCMNQLVHNKLRLDHLSQNGWTIGYLVATSPYTNQPAVHLDSSGTSWPDRGERHTCPKWIGWYT